MIKEFQYSFKELELVASDLNELLGFEDDSIPEPFPKLIETIWTKIPEHCNIRGGLVIFDSVNTDVQTRTIKIGKQLLHTAKIVVNQLKSATGAAVFVCTAGYEISVLSRKMAEQGDLMMSYITDVVGSLIVDRTMEKIHDWLESNVNKNEMNVSDRFSPGYCEWNVAEQQKLFKLLPEGFCGIKLSGTSLMYPVKSASGIIGIGQDLSRKGYQCYWCSDRNCIYGKINRKKKQKKIV